MIKRPAGVNRCFCCVGVFVLVSVCEPRWVFKILGGCVQFHDCSVHACLFMWGIFMRHPFMVWLYVLVCVFTFMSLFANCSYVCACTCVWCRRARLEWEKRRISKSSRGPIQNGGFHVDHTHNPRWKLRQQMHSHGHTSPNHNELSKLAHNSHPTTTHSQKNPSSDNKTLKLIQCIHLITDWDNIINTHPERVPVITECFRCIVGLFQRYVPFKTKMYIVGNKCSLQFTILSVFRGLEKNYNAVYTYKTWTICVKHNEFWCHIRMTSCRSSQTDKGHSMPILMYVTWQHNVFLIMGKWLGVHQIDMAPWIHAVNYISGKVSHWDFDTTQTKRIVFSKSVSIHLYFIKNTGL